jgi:predicted Zn-dependent protease
MICPCLIACSVNPATGQRQFNIMSESQEIDLGRQAAPGFVSSYGGEIPSASIRQYVSDLGSRLAEVSERPDLPWEFNVVDSPTTNAFALPGGKVFMSRGLLEKMTNEAQLAGVLGHEVGHVTAQHIGQQMSQAMAIQLIGVGLAVAGEQADSDALRVLGAGSTVGGSMYLLKFGRDQESQADMLGLRYMTKLGYNPAAQIQVMRILKEASGDGGGAPEWLSTHPLPDTRIDRLEKIIQQQYPDYNDTNKYNFHVERFRREVLDVLATLPPAAHDPQAPQPQAP